jgi:cathepsin L
MHHNMFLTKESGVVLTMNSFSDMSNKEFSERMNGYKDNSNGVRNPVMLNTSGNADSINWVSKGAVTPVKNQGQCGSCWAFSTTGSMEGAHQIATGNLVSLSEQQFVDCATAEGNQGCNGGLMDNAFKYAEKVAIETEAEYPYTAKDGTCKVKSNASGVNVKSF